MISRRNFTKASLALSVTGCSSSTVANGGLIDAHSHAWSPSYRLRQGRTAADLSPQQFAVERLMQIGGACGVRRFVLIQHIYYHGWDSSYLCNAVEKYRDRFAVVGALDVNESAFEESMDRGLQRGISGYRITSAGKNSNWLEGKDMQRFWEAAAQRDIAVCLLRFPDVGLSTVAAMCRKNLRTRVVLDHFAHVDLQDDREVNELLSLAEYPNVYIKLSKFYGNGRAQAPYKDMLPLIKSLLKAFGSERLMWASDCPYQVMNGHNYRNAFDIVDQAPFLTDAERENIFQRTAESVYFKPVAE